MIEPTKHLDLDLSVFRISALILKELMRKRIVKYNELKEKLVKRTSVDVTLMMLPALNLLFLLGRVEYHAKTDSFEYIFVRNDKK
jgi:hypothetical protein